MAATSPLRLSLPAFQALLAKAGLDAYWVPSGDEHQNEYVPVQRQRRVWLTGFTGSAGDLLVLRDRAYLLVDSRYHEQVDQEVDTTQITPIKLGATPDTPTLLGLLKDLLETHLEATRGDTFKLGVDDTLTPAAQAAAFRSVLGDQGEVVPTDENLVDTLAGEHLLPDERAALASLTPPSSIYPLPAGVTGKTFPEKVAALRAEMARKHIGLLPLIKLDQVAWLTNLRGADIPYNPVFHAYGLLTQESCYLFLDEAGLTPEAVDRLHEEPSLVVEPYLFFHAVLKMLEEVLPGGDAIGWTPSQMPESVARLVENRRKVTLDVHPVDMMKALKTPEELAAMRDAGLKASRAKHQFLSWVRQQTDAGVAITERQAAEALEIYYAEQPGYAMLSFNVIAGYGPNGAIVHYGTPSDTTTLKPGGLFLVDSGAQYLGGTTDCTRTLIIGEPTRLQQERYTLVLKAHIRGAMQVFPEGTTGAAIDAICRSALWNAGLNYGHGTGHGVGAFLNVHEGPHGIHSRTTTPLKAGMISSVEPGYYQSGWGGIRLENLVEVAPATHLGPGWLKLEPLEWVPFDERLILHDWLTQEEHDWLVWYHHECQCRL